MKTGTGVAIAFALCIAAPAQAGDCNSMIARFMGHLKKDPHHVVLANVTTNQSDRNFASATFNIVLTAANDTTLDTLPGSSGWQFFSDRALFTGAADRLGLRIVAGTPPGVELILISWGNGVSTGTPIICDGDLMVGTVGHDAAFSISLTASQR